MIPAMRTRSVSPLSTLGRSSWTATVAAFALLCATTTFWCLQWLAPRSPTAPVAATGSGGPADLRLASALFGTASTGPAVAAEASNLKVLGVLSAGTRGSAIISVDGKPGKAFTVGEPLSAAQSLVEVRRESIVISTGGRRGELPAPPRQSLSILTSGPDRNGAASPSAAPAQAPAFGAAAGTPGAPAAVSAPPQPIMTNPGESSGGQPSVQVQRQD